MHPSDFRNRVGDCPKCGRRIRLNFEGRYRRHFATQPDGCLRLCRGSGKPAAQPSTESVASSSGVDAGRV